MTNNYISNSISQNAGSKVLQPLVLQPLVPQPPIQMLLTLLIYQFQPKQMKIRKSIVWL